MYNELFVKGQRKKAWNYSKPFTYTISLYKYYTLKWLFCLYFCVLFYFLYTSQSFTTSDFVAMQVKANIKIFSKNIDNGSTWEYTKAIVKEIASAGLHLGGGKGYIMESRFQFESWTEWDGNNYVTSTKVYDWGKADATWNGCHWDNPAIIKAETVEGECWSDEMSAFVRSVGATDIEEAENGSY